MNKRFGLLCGRSSFQPFAFVLGGWLAFLVAETPPAFGQAAFVYPPITSPILSATFSVDFAGMQADTYVGSTQVNSVQLWDPANMTSVDLTSAFFGNSVWPNPPQIDQSSTQTGFFSANIPGSFYGALQTGQVGLTAMFTDTGDGFFAIGTIELNITTASGTSSYWYGSPPNGFGIGIPAGGNLPGPLPGSLPYTGTGFDEAISGKDISAIPEPGTNVLLTVGLVTMALVLRRGGARLAALALLLTIVATAPAQGQAPPASITAVLKAKAAQPPPKVASVDHLGREFVPGEVLVVFKPNVADAARKNSAERARTRIIKEYSAVNVHHLRIRAGQTVDGAVRALQADPSVLAASPNYIRHYQDNPNLVAPNDPSYPMQWALNNNGRASLFIPSILHADPNNNGAYDTGEAIYNDVDGNGMVSAGDILISGPAQANGTRLIPFVAGAFLNYVDANGNGFYDEGEAVYKDVDQNGLVSVGDIRVVPQAGSGLPAGPVVAGDADIGTTLSLVFPLVEMYNDANHNGLYDAGETIYWHIYSGETVRVGDLRRTAFGALAPGEVAAGDADVCAPLSFFRNGDVKPIIDADIDAPQGWVFGTDCSAAVCAVIDSGFDVNHPDLGPNMWVGPLGENGQSFSGIEAHDETVELDGLYENGEGIYLDSDGSGNVTPGDERLTAIPMAGAAGTIVANCDADFGHLLVPFVTGVEPRHELHTEQIAVDNRFNVGEYVYNDVDNNQRVSVGDVRLSAVTEGANNYAPGSVVAAGDTDAVPRPLTAFAAMERHAENIFVNGRYDNGEFIYRDNDNSMTVTAGDTRLTPVLIPPLVVPYAAGSVVAAGDADLGTALVAFQANELHDTSAGAGNYIFGDGIYRDLDGSRTITVGDIRITAAAGSGLQSAGVVASDSDVLPRILVPFVSFYPERHTENIAVNGRYDAGEFVYIDVNQNGRVSPGDIRTSAVPGRGAAGSTVAAGDGDVGQALVDFTTAEAHDNTQAATTVSALFTQGDGIYVDNDNSGSVTVGDTRIVGPAGAGLAAGAVAAGDADIGRRLYCFTVSERHNDPNNDGLYQSPEYVVNNRAENGRISPNDQRMQASTFGGFAAGTFVAAADADAGVPLIFFANRNGLNERHAENIAVNDRYDAGEFIYNDADDSMDVSVGDVRLTDVPGSGAAGTVVAAGDADIGTDLIDFAENVESDDIQDNNGHGTGVAGVIGAVGNNGQGIAGVCWKAQIMGVRAGAGNLSDATLIACVNYVAEQKAAGVDVRVVNISIGGTGYDAAYKTAINNACYTGSGMIFTLSAGNSGVNNDPDGPPGQAVYRTGGNTVAPGATRVTAFGPPSLGLPAGSVVAAGDPDVGSNLVNFLSIEKYNDANGNGRYDAGERVYQDLDGNGVVSVGDYRLAATESIGIQYPVGYVKAGDTDVGLPLTPFAPNEKHIDTGTVAGQAGYFAGSTPNYPASFNLPRVVSVAASDSDDNLAKFSNWGTNSVHLAAPGVGILTLRPESGGGGVQYIDGTSFASPLVAGILYHMWTRPAFLPDGPDLIISFLLADANGRNFSAAGPHGIDHRYGLRNTVMSGGTNHDGRARLDTGDDFGDAPDPSYPTTMQNWGARAEDLGEEWLGRDPALPLQWVYNIPQVPPPPTGSTPEYDAFNGPLWPPDPDGVQNLINMDAADDGVMLLGPFQFSQPGLPPAQATVRIFVDTANNDVADAASGRYALAGANPLGTSVAVPGDGVHGPGNNRNLWVNAWFDWNRNGSFDDPNEHVFMLACNPTAFVPAHGAVYDVTFNMPPAPAGATNGPLYARFRLDYGENSGQMIPPNSNNPVLPHNVGPSPAGQVMFWDDPGGLPLPGPTANRWESLPVGKPFIQPSLFTSRGLARYGEVEDYLVSGPLPDQLHLYGPNPNFFETNVSQTIEALVENSFVGLEGEVVDFASLLGNIQFTSGAVSNNGAATAEVTDASGEAVVSFVGTGPGPALVQATVEGTGLTAYVFMQVQAGPTMGIAQAAARNVTLQLAGLPGQLYTVQRSTDLETWTPITTVTAPDSGLIEFTDTTAPSTAAFYRAVIASQ